jgi:HK97 family phage major capsid protein
MKKLEAGALKTDKTPYSAEEIKAHNEFIDLVIDTNKEQIVGLITKEEAEEITNKAIEAANAELKAELKTLRKGFVEQGLEIAKKNLNANQNQIGNVSLGTQMLKAFEEKSSEIKTILDQNGMRKGQDLDITVKTVGVITELSTILAAGTYNSLTQDTGIISPIRRREEAYLQSVTTGQIGTRFAMWIEETDEEGTPIMIAENTGKTQIDVQYLEKTQKVEKIAVYSKVTTEMMADLPQLVSRIQTNMLKRVGVAIESQLYSGSGTSPYLKGATGWATSFSAGSLANTIPYANEIDVINAIENQVLLAFGTTNAILVHPDTIQKIKGLKSTTGEPLWKEYQDWSLGGSVTSLMIGGMKVIPTPVVTSGDFLGGDMSVLNVLFREGLNIRITPSGDDPINNTMTLIVEARLVQFASANDVTCLIKGDFTTAIAALQSIA